jgi:hypothetical protein
MTGGITLTAYLKGIYELRLSIDPGGIAEL